MPCLICALQAEKNKRLIHFSVFLMKSQAVIEKKARASPPSQPQCSSNSGSSSGSSSSVDEDILAAKLELFR